MGLATESANLVGCWTPFGMAARRIYEEAIEWHPELARKDFSSVYKYIEAMGLERDKK